MRALLLVALLLPATAVAETSLTFQGRTYLHRWSKGGQHEFTPKGQEDLARWTDMVTLLVRDEVTDGEQLAQYATAIATNYGNSGRVLRTDSSPRTKEREAEHFVAAVFGDPRWLEAAFAHVALREGRGVAVVYSHRVYGEAVGDTMSQWLETKASATEIALRAFTGLPTLAVLRALPQAPDAPVSAVPAGAEGAVQQLAKLGYPNPRDADQYVGAAFQGQEDLVKLFLDAGLAVDAPNHLGDRALLMAVMGGYVDLAAFLLDKGADPRHKDSVGRTALYELAGYCDETKLVRALLAKGADPKAATNGGQTPLAAAREHGCTDIAAALRKAGAVK